MERESDNHSTIGKDLAGKYLTFSLSEERYGLEILKVQEIIGVPSITYVPKSPVYVKGVINLRGRIIPLIDLRTKFSLPTIGYDEKTCIIVVTMVKGETKIAVGVIVDTVLEVIDFAAREIEPAPDYGNQIDSHFIIGMGCKDGGALNILIDIEKALEPKEISQLVEVTK